MKLKTLFTYRPGSTWASRADRAAAAARISHKVTLQILAVTLNAPYAHVGLGIRLPYW